jgi:hypothetical protein
VNAGLPCTSGGDCPGSSCTNLYWHADAEFTNAASPAGITLPAGRSRVCFDVDSTALKLNTRAPYVSQFYILPTTAASSDIEAVDGWWLEVRATGTCGNATSFSHASQTLSGNPFASSGILPEIAGTRHCTVVDTGAWDFSANDFSTSFGSQACRASLFFGVTSEKADAARVVKFKSITVEELSRSIRVIVGGHAGANVASVRTTDWPAMRKFHCTDPSTEASCFASQRTRPITATIASVGGNDVAGGGGTTLTSYGIDLDGLIQDMADVGVPIFVKALTLSRDLGSTMITANNQNISRGEAFRAFLSAERAYLRSKMRTSTNPVVRYLDTQRIFYPYDDAVHRVNLTTEIPRCDVNGANCGPPTSGAQTDYPMGSPTWTTNGARVIQAFLCSSVTTSGNASGNQWCFNIVNTHTGLTLSSFPHVPSGNDPCQGGAGISEFTAGRCIQLSITQNGTIESGQSLACRMEQVGTAPAWAADARIVCGVELDVGGQYGNESPCMADGKHFGSSCFLLAADAFYKTLTGRDPYQGTD